MWVTNKPSGILLFPQSILAKSHTIDLSTPSIGSKYLFKFPLLIFLLLVSNLGQYQVLAAPPSFLFIFPIFPLSSFHFKIISLFSVSLNPLCRIIDVPESLYYWILILKIWVNPYYITPRDDSIVELNYILTRTNPYCCQLWPIPCV